MAAALGVTGLAGAGCLGLLLILSVFIATGGFVGGLIIWAAWNIAAVPLFHAPRVTYWQAFLVALAIGFIGGCLRTARQGGGGQ